MVAVAELVGRVGASAALDDAVGAIKQRDRGVSAGEFLVAVAQAQMCGAEFWTVSTPAKAVAEEAWHRMRTDIEDRIRVPITVPRCDTCPPSPVDRG
jgi:hypothetical protein